MRFYDVASETARQRALKDLSTNIRDVWLRLPKEWRIDKEFVLKVLELGSVSIAEIPHGDERKDSDEEEDCDAGYSLDDTYKELHNVVVMNPIDAYCFECCSDDEESIGNSPMALPSQSEFERAFPRSLRFDRDVVLAWTRRSDFPLLYKTRQLYLPSCLCRDKEVCLAYCRQIPRSLQDCHLDLCDDELMVTTAVECCGGLEFQYASPRLRCEESVVRKACASDGKALLFCPRISDAFANITRDRDFVYNVITGAGTNDCFRGVDQLDGKSNGRRSRAVSRRLSGSVWKLLSSELKQSDRELALAALRNGLSFREIPKHFIDLPFLRRALANNSFPLYLELSEEWQSNPRLAMDAILAEDSTPSVHARAFAFLQSLEKKWFRGNITKNSAGTQLGDEEYHEDSIDPFWFPLRDNRELVLVVCKRGSKKLLHELLGKPLGYPGWVGYRILNNIPNRASDAGNDDNDDDSRGELHGRRESDARREGRVVADTRPLFRMPNRPSRLLDDFEVMKLAVNRDPNIYDNISRRLRLNLDMILASISDAHSAWCRLKTIPWSIQRRHPEITLKCLRYTEISHVMEFMGASIIPTDVWTSNRELKIAWIRRRGVLCQWFFPDLYTDEEMALEVAKHNHTQFHKVGENFLNNRNFVEKALERNGQCIESISSLLMRDFDLLTTAAANYYNWLDRVNANPLVRKMNLKPRIKPMGGIFRGYCDLGEFKQKIHDKLELHEIFVSGFLRGIAIPSDDSKLGMLDRGVETSEAFKKLIAEYLAVAFGKKLKCLRRALLNIERPESEWTQQQRLQMTGENPDLNAANLLSFHGTRRPMRRRLVAQIRGTHRRAVRARVHQDNVNNHERIIGNLMARDLRPIRAGEPVEDLEGFGR